MLKSISDKRASGWRGAGLYVTLARGFVVNASVSLSANVLKRKPSCRLPARADNSIFKRARGADNLDIINTSLTGRFRPVFFAENISWCLP